MKRLLVLRHAKSSWSSEGLADHDRPLNARGERAAVLMGAALAQRAFLPGAAFCSTARRARDTFERVAAQLPEPVPASFEKGLYLAPPDAWLERLQVADDEVSTLLLVGHNPGLEELVGWLAPSGEAGAVARLRQGLPTAALAVIEAPAERWSQVAPGRCSLRALSRPKDLV